MLPETLDLATCSASTLSSWLLENRFQNDQTETTTFLLETISSLPDAEKISEQLVASASAEEDVLAEHDVEDAMLDEPVIISCTAPRCKFQVTLLKQGVVFEEATRTSTSSTDSKQPKQRFMVESIDYMIAFPKPRDCQPQKKVPSDMLLLVLPKDSGVTYKQKPIQQLCFQLPEGLPVLKQKQSTEDDDLSLDGLDSTDQWMRVFSQALGGLEPRAMIRVVNPALPNDGQDNHFWRYQFRSYQEEGVSTTTGDLPFVSCNMGVKDGSLYPLQEGLLFFSPPLFLPRSRLVSIDCGRAGNTNSRYFDLKVTTEDGEHIEFTNIHRNELTVLNNYVYKTLIPAMQKDVQEAEAGGTPVRAATVAMAEDTNSDDEADLDVSMETHPPTTAKKLGRFKRQASLEAMRINKSVLSSGDMGHDSDDDESDYELKRAGDDDEDEHSEGESSDGEDVSADGSVREAVDEETESEDEEGNASAPIAKKARKS